MRFPSTFRIHENCIQTISPFLIRMAQSLWIKSSSNPFFFCNNCIPTVILFWSKLYDSTQVPSTTSFMPILPSSRQHLIYGAFFPFINCNQQLYNSLKRLASACFSPRHLLRCLGKRMGFGFSMLLAKRGRIKWKKGCEIAWNKWCILNNNTMDTAEQVPLSNLLKCYNTFFH